MVRGSHGNKSVLADCKQVLNSRVNLLLYIFTVLILPLYLVWSMNTVPRGGGKVIVGPGKEPGSSVTSLGTSICAGLPHPDSLSHASLSKPGKPGLSSMQLNIIPADGNCSLCPFVLSPCWFWGAHVFSFLPIWPQAELGEGEKK